MHAIQYIDASIYNPNGTSTKLGDLINELPHGIVDKSITGLGGTTLELDSPRPSVIVEPLNITAYTKAKKRTRNNNFEVFYFGTKSGPITEDPASLLNALNKDNRELLRVYLKKCRTLKQPPKILCISDQLQNLKSSLKELNQPLEGFHLLLDEIDSMQDQIGFRNVMFDCINMYKEHPTDKRTMLSATINKFHDPELEFEPYTKFRFADFATHPCTIHLSQNHAVRISILVNEIQNSYPGEKILIALNNVELIYELISHLTSSGIERSSIAALCSEASKKKVEEYYVSLDDTLLPAEINIITAAYFSGFDLDESAHLLVSVDARNYVQHLSSKTIYQIHGRLREGVRSFNLVCHFVKPSLPAVTSEDIMEAVEQLHDTMTLFNKFKNSKNEFLKKNAKIIQNIFVNGNEGLRSIWSYKGDQMEVNYLKIDSLIEDDSTRQALSSYKAFKGHLKDYFDIQGVFEHSDKIASKQKESIEDVRATIRKIKGLDFYNPEDKPVLTEIKKSLKSGPSKKIIEIALKAFGKGVFRLEVLVDRMEALLNEEDWQTKISQLEQFVLFHGLTSSGNLGGLDNYMLQNFGRLQKLTSTAFKEHLALCLQDLVVRSQLLSNDQKRMAKTLNSPLKFEKSLLQIETSRTKKNTFKEVVGFDPYDLLNLKDYPNLDLQAIKKEGKRIVMNKRLKSSTILVSSELNILELLHPDHRKVVMLMPPEQRSVIIEYYREQLTKSSKD